MKILFISLGCDKNLVDTEMMLGQLSEEGFTFTDDETQAEVIVVNTCCFINDAKEESINTILEMAELKITLVKSPIGAVPKHKATVEALGLKKVNSFKIHNATDSILGMIKKVSYLVKVENV